MNALQVDSATGFLTANNHNSFTAEKKLEFLAAARKYADARQLPDIGKMCDELNVSYEAFTDHLEKDDAFKAEWQKIKKRTYYGLANELSVKANTKGGIIANLAALKYLEKGRFSDDEPIQNTDFTFLKRLADSLKPDNSKAVEAEIVDKSSDK